MAEKLWTVNAIKDANRAAGGHWFDPDTMRFFGTRVLAEVYQGPGGIYFVTSDKQYNGTRGYTVRRFDPADGSPHTIGEVAGLTKGKAQRTARNLAASDGECQATREEYRPVSVLAQFSHDLQQHTRPHRGTETDTVDAARNLIRLAAKHHKLMELLCSDEAFCREVNEDGEHPKVIACRKRISAVAESIGVGVLFSGDPRRCTVKLTFADGFTNDFGKEGYCVPTESK